MSSTRWAWIAAVTVGSVEGFKDQGLCRSIHQYAKNNRNYVGLPFSLSKHKQFSASLVPAESVNQDRSKVPEESLRTVMFLSCWGPNN